MELDKAIQKRRSTREFDSIPVSKDNLKKLIESARLAPSAGNCQNWFFVVLEGDIKNRVAGIMEEQIKNMEITMDESENVTHAYNPTSSVKGSIKIIREAPVFILVFRKYSEDWKYGDYLSIGCAVEHICLKATDLGLVTGLAIDYSSEYLSIKTQKEFRRYYGM